MKVKEIRLTISEMAEHLGQTTETITRRLQGYKPLGADDEGQPLYGIAHLCLAGFKP